MMAGKIQNKKTRLGNASKQYFTVKILKVSITIQCSFSRIFHLTASAACLMHSLFNAQFPLNDVQLYKKMQVGTYNNDDVIGQDKFLSKKNFKNNLAFKMFQFPPLFILVMLSINGSTHLDFLSKTIQNKHYFLSTILTSIIFKYSISCFRGRLERERGG